MLDIIKKTENAKYNWCLENLDSLFLYRRFELDELLTKLTSLGFLHTWDEDSIKNQEDMIDNELLSSDYYICIGINENWGYIDIYYLKDLQGNMFITELNISEE